MTVSSTTTKAQYSGNGTTTVFAVPFYFLLSSDLLVILRSPAGVEAAQALTTNYTVAGAGNENGGSITMLVPPAVGSTLTILRNASATQETDLIPNDRLPAESLETALDKLTMLVQQIDEVGDRSLQFPASDPAASPTIPIASTRANKFLSFNASGLPVATVGVDASLDVFIQAGSGAVPRSVNDKLRDMVSVKDFGVVGDGVADDRAALLLARDYAISSGKGLWCPSGMTVRLGSSTDLRGVKRLNFESNILIPSGTLTVGGFFNSGGGDIRLANVTNGASLFGAPPASPVLRVTGLSESFVSLGACNYAQLYAEGSGEDRSVSYNQFRITGMVALLELTDGGVGGLPYVNENFIYADRLVRLSIIGVNYPHNHNKIFHPCMEGADVSLTFTNATHNSIYGARFEDVSGAPGVTFASSAYNNIITSSWSSVTYNQFRVIIPVSDSGQNNMVTTEAATLFRKVPILSVDANSMIVGTATACSAPDKRIAPTINGMSTLSSPALITPSLAGFTVDTSTPIAVSDLIPVSLGDVVVWDWDFSGSLLRPIVWVYDANQSPLLSEGAGGAFYSQVDVTSFDTTYGAYTAGSGLPATVAPGYVRRSEVKFIRVGAFCSTAGLIKSMSMSIFTQALGRGASESASRSQYSLPVLDGAPTRGYVPFNYAVWDKTAKVMRWVSYQFETKLNGALSAGGTSATVAAAGSIANSDICGILLDNGTTHWSSISSLSGSTFTISAIPAGRSAANGARIVFNRWAS
jgi:hypothetical protein